MKKNLVFLLVLSILACKVYKKEDEILGLKIAAIERAGGSQEEKIEVYKEFIRRERANVSKIISSVEKVTRYYIFIGLQFLDLEKYGAALENFNEALILSPKNYMIHYYQGISAFHLWQDINNLDREKYLKLSEAALLKSIEIKDDFKNGLFTLANLYIYHLQKQEEAKIYLDKLSNLNENSMQFWIMRGVNYYALGSYERADIAYEEALKLAKSQDERDKITSLRSSLFR